jgi:acetyl-CoA carboxylase carboxyltransferase component
VFHNARMTELRSPLQARIVEWQVRPGDAIDAVIDPAQTRHWLARGLAAAITQPGPQTAGVDTW